MTVDILKQGAVHVFRPKHPLNLEYAEQFGGQMREHCSAGLPLIVLDLGQVSLIDSFGLESLLDDQDVIERKGGVVKLANANPLCHDILRATGVAERFEIYPDVKSAVGSFAR